MKNFLIFLLPSRKQSHNVSVVCKDLPDTKFIDLNCYDMRVSDMIFEKHKCEESMQITGENLRKKKIWVSDQKSNLQYLSIFKEGK